MPYISKTPTPPCYTVVFTMERGWLPIDAWARDPEHQVAKRKGRETSYSHYMIPTPTARPCPNA